MMLRNLHLDKLIPEDSIESILPTPCNKSPPFTRVFSQKSVTPQDLEKTLGIFPKKITPSIRFSSPSKTYDSPKSITKSYGMDGDNDSIDSAVHISVFKKRDFERERIERDMKERLEQREKERELEKKEKEMMFHGYKSEDSMSVYQPSHQPAHNPVLHPVLPPIQPINHPAPQTSSVLPSIPKMFKSEIKVVGGRKSKDERVSSIDTPYAHESGKGGGRERERKMKTKQNIKPTRIYSTAPILDDNGEEPDWNSMPEDQYNKYLNAYIVKFENLITSNKNFNIKMPSDDMDLAAIVKRYRDEVKRITLSRMTGNWKCFLFLFNLVIEIGIRWWMPTAEFMKGYAIHQYKKMYMYEQSIIEIGEMYSDKEQDKRSPIMNVLIMSGIQALLFIGVSIICKWMNNMEDGKGGEKVSRDSLLKICDMFYQPPQPTTSSSDDKNMPEEPPTFEQGNMVDGLINMVGKAAGNDGMSDILSNLGGIAKLFGGSSGSGGGNGGSESNGNNKNIIFT